MNSRLSPSRNMLVDSKLEVFSEMFSHHDTLMPRSRLKSFVSFTFFHEACVRL